MKNVATVTRVESVLRIIDHRPVGVVPLAMRLALWAT